LRDAVFQDLEVVDRQVLHEGIPVENSDGDFDIDDADVILEGLCLLRRSGPPARISRRKTGQDKGGGRDRGPAPSWISGRFVHVSSSRLKPTREASVRDVSGAIGQAVLPGLDLDPDAVELAVSDVIGRTVIERLIVLRGLDRGLHHGDQVQRASREAAGDPSELHEEGAGRPSQGPSRRHAMRCAIH